MHLSHLSQVRTVRGAFEFVEQILKQAGFTEALDENLDPNLSLRRLHSDTSAKSCNSLATLLQNVLPLALLNCDNSSSSDPQKVYCGDKILGIRPMTEKCSALVGALRAKCYLRPRNELRDDHPPLEGKDLVTASALRQLIE